MSRVEYSLYIVNPENGDRHHYTKAWSPRGIRREATWLHQEIRRGAGSKYRMHGGWSTGLEAWEIHPGEHGWSTGPDGLKVYAPAAPDRLLIHATWNDEDLTFTDPDFEEASRYE